MQHYSIHKLGKEYVIQAEGKDVLVCKSRREAERVVYDASELLEASTKATQGSQDEPVIQMQRKKRA